MAVKFINITESDFLSKKVLYKYMPLESALATIKEKYMWFANPVVWKDPFEKRFIEAKYKVGAAEKDFPLNGRVFCSCLTQTQTSEAHWNTYLSGHTGIRLTYGGKNCWRYLITYLIVRCILELFRIIKQVI